MHQNAWSLLPISSGEIITVCVSRSPSPPPIGGRMTMEGEWEDSEKTAGEKNRGRLGSLKTPVFQIPSAHKPPARCVRLNAFLMLHLSAVCLFVGLSLIFISKVSFIFWQTQKCSMGKIFQKTVGDKLQSNSTGWNIYLRCSARHATQLCLAPPFPYVYGCMLPDVIEVKCLCLRVQQLHLGFHPENLLFIEPPPICWRMEKHIKVLPYLSLQLCSFPGP